MDINIDEWSSWHSSQLFQNFSPMFNKNIPNKMTFIFLSDNSFAEVFTLPSSVSSWYLLSKIESLNMGGDDWGGKESVDFFESRLMTNGDEGFMASMEAEEMNVDSESFNETGDPGLVLVGDEG